MCSVHLPKVSGPIESHHFTRIDGGLIEQRIDLNALSHPQLLSLARIQGLSADQRGVLTSMLDAIVQTGIVFLIPLV